MTKTRKRIMPTHFRRANPELRKAITFAQARCTNVYEGRAYVELWEEPGSDDPLRGKVRVVIIDAGTKKPVMASELVRCSWVTAYDWIVLFKPYLIERRRMRGNVSRRVFPRVMGAKRHPDTGVRLVPGVAPYPVALRPPPKGGKPKSPRYKVVAASALILAVLEEHAPEPVHLQQIVALVGENEKAMGRKPPSDVCLRVNLGRMAKQGKILRVEEALYQSVQKPVARGE